MPVQRIKKHLDEKQIKYLVISHSPAYTAQEIAAAAHIPGREMAKTVMITVDGKMVMAVVPATCYVDLDRLQEMLGAKTVDLATEEEFEYRFPDCELGAMPPFGELYDMNVYVAADLALNERIAFNAGTLYEVIRMAYSDFEKLVNPKVIDFGLR